MQKIEVKIKKLHDDSKVPIYKTTQAAGFDIYSIEEVLLKANSTAKISTGFALEIPHGFYLRIEDRSGMAAKGIHKIGGIVDSDYRGEVFVVLHNTTNQDYQIEKHDRIAQGVVTPVSQANFNEASQLSETERDEGGFGSTGKKD